ncbi:MAG TPA: bifunctional 2-C-methyl-D-erythritol 4-phosphate cytidylyltransferase/2-C-methyl-D-erythritol 2,4-cyclodiphosphate synthase [Geminicoccaceae bacterium]|nr:bifunctional 2-C-methyl-D-erythritol 4-phosphate cytidylyltransferase/2-C-methyl-D-erythritol 2,4-cyclodiphosphate synthase [Geminicoccaceae bacterium]
MALIVAAGSGQRFGGLPKQYRPLGGKPVARRAVEAFAGHAAVDAVTLVIDDAHRDLYGSALAGFGLPPPVTGGATRQESVRRGLESLVPLAPDTVLIHDAARPLVSAALIERVVAALHGHDAVLPVRPVVDTLKRVADATVLGEVAREGVARAQTPQGFRFTAILEAHRALAGGSFTDDAAVAAAAGIAVHAVAGEEANLKITLPEDLAEAERRLGAARRWRTGTGFDVHRLVPGRRLLLCGVEVPFERGLDGHSDADVALHAITDAILGTIPAGDIGSHFPPSDPRWKDADSARFLVHAGRLLAAAGGTLELVDVTILCERPKLAPHRARMRERVARILGIGLDQVGVKATTTEGLGFTGRGEGIAAQAAVTAAFGP